MKKLTKQVEEIGRQASTASLREIKSELQGALPDHISVTQHDGGIAVRSSHLEQDILHHAALRDVAFLMRGVKRGAR